ncbi:MAG TPA: calcium/proton exchanger [Ktedonobacterales bacterium]
MSRWLYLLLIAAPLALILRASGAGPLAVFVMASLGLIPLAGLIGMSTEALAERVGPTIGGLLNATFGNAAEIIIGLAALAAGLPEVVRASLAGSIIGNSLLVLGSAMVVGGWRYRRQIFDARIAGQYASMLALVVAGMAIPSLLWTIGEAVPLGQAVVRGEEFHRLSIGVSVILLACYLAYIAYSVFGVRADPDNVLRSGVEPEHREDTGAMEENRQASDAARVSPHTRRRARSSGTSAIAARMTELWHGGIWLPIVLLAAVTAATAFVSEALVGTIEPLADEIGLNPFFVGLIVLPIVGNAAEHFTAITSAAHNHMEIAMAITAGSSIQIALLATPVLVFAGALIGAPLDLNFSLLEVAIFGLVAGLYALISLDGESTWLEGVLLCAFYLILAVGTFFTPA